MGMWETAGQPVELHMSRAASAGRRRSQSVACTVLVMLSYHGDQVGSATAPCGAFDSHRRLL